MYDVCQTEHEVFIYSSLKRFSLHYFIYIFLLMFVYGQNWMMYALCFMNTSRCFTFLFNVL